MIPQPLVESRQLGRLRIHAIQAGGQRLDGGAMFGVVPKPLWEKRIAADERNRIQLGMRCLLIEHDIGPILIDTGAGNKEDPKFYDIYGIENSRRAGTDAARGRHSRGGLHARADRDARDQQPSALRSRRRQHDQGCDRARARRSRTRGT